ncbi:peptidase S10 [Bradyrhizobium sp.]|uniref:S10 family peptidase n=1 Tax=Bradyrhizobium sp. TaxID=376 RepID=UPI002627A924|nr:peptidase S10 [Bradyrhizobium sp.]
MGGAGAQDARHEPLSQATSASPPSGQKAGQSASRSGAATMAETRRLPEDSTTKHSINVSGRTLAFTATAGSLRLFNGKGEPQADIAYTAYQLDGADPHSRPVTFFFNGGPGASSAYLQFGCAGPWRLPIEGEAAIASASPELKPNAETWLDFTDLVFIDPVDTGYSRFVSTEEDVRKHFFSVDGDVNAMAVAIRRYLEKYDRLLSPKFIVGESYSGIRGPKLVRELEKEQGVGVRGLILISPVFDFREFGGTSILQYVISLPSMAAVAREAKHSVTRADMADVETYARSDFIADLIKGEADKEATTRLADRVSALTGIDQAVTRQLAGRLDVSEFRREFDRRDGKVTGRYDGSVLGFDPDPDSSQARFPDPSGDPLIAPLTSAAVDLTRRTLNWRPDGPYHLLNGSVEHSWDFGRGLNPPQSISQLRQILAFDPKLKLLVGHGLFDLATPYFGSKIWLDQLPAYASPDRVKLVVYPGGHMFYSRDGSRQAFRAEAEALMK